MNWLKGFCVFALLFMTTQLWAMGGQPPSNGGGEQRFLGYQVKNMNSATGTLTYGIEYPRNFDETKRYPILFCLPGGDFASNLAAYYNVVYTPSTTFQNYIKIYAINNDQNKVLNFQERDWRAYVQAIKDNEFGNDSGWVISGSSNGGFATFRLLKASPETFRGFIVIPGRMEAANPLPQWKEMDGLLVYGTEDSGWIQPSINTYNKLKGKIRAIDIMALEGRGHVLPFFFNINPIYEAFEDLYPGEE